MITPLRRFRGLVGLYVGRSRVLDIGSDIVVEPLEVLPVLCKKVLDVCSEKS